MCSLWLHAKARFAKETISIRHARNLTIAANDQIARDGNQHHLPGRDKMGLPKQIALILPNSLCGSPLRRMNTTSGCPLAALSHQKITTPTLSPCLAPSDSL